MRRRSSKTVERWGLDQVRRQPLRQKPSGFRRLMTCRERKKISERIEDNDRRMERVKVRRKLTV